jgi:adenylosuccinate lyase
MIPRYRHPTVESEFSDLGTYLNWLEVERVTLAVQMQHGVVPTNDLTRALETALARVALYSDEHIAEIKTLELQTGHDVAAFLGWLRARVPHGQWVHFGLTSSDVVDTGQAMHFRALGKPLHDELIKLAGLLSKSIKNDLPVLGKTHGQAAEPTSMRVRSWHWLSTIETPLLVLSDMTKRMCVCKLSGPVGTFAHNPPEVEREVARRLGLIPQGAGASQIVPRTPLALWAAAASTLLGAYAKIAMDLRLMNLDGEVYWPRKPSHVASSAMAHKNNPIEAEQMSGFYRISQGYATMLQPMELWLERDISHSSVERVAVPDLWHILMTATQRMYRILESMSVRPLITSYNLAENSNAAWCHKVTLEAIRGGMSWLGAREYAREYDTEPYDVDGDAKRFSANFPKGKE